MIKTVERKRNRAIIALLIRPLRVRKIAIAFIDNIAFTLNREKRIEKMQRVINTYKKLYEAIGRKI